MLGHRAARASKLTRPPNRALGHIFKPGLRPQHNSCRASGQEEFVMPTIRLAVPPKAWTREEKAQLIAELTDALAKTAEACGKGDIRQFVGVQIDETAEGGYAIGGNIFG